MLYVACHMLCVYVCILFTAHLYYVNHSLLVNPTGLILNWVLTTVFLVDFYTHSIYLELKSWSFLITISTCRHFQYVENASFQGFWCRNLFHSWIVSQYRKLHHEYSWISVLQILLLMFASPPFYSLFHFLSAHTYSLSKSFNVCIFLLKLNIRGHNFLQS